MHHQRYGTLIRLGAVITSAEMPEIPSWITLRVLRTARLSKSLPVKAFGDEGSFKR